MCFPQRWRLAEVRAEDYAFLLLSRVVGLLEADGPAVLAESPDSKWAKPLCALVLAVRQASTKHDFDCCVTTGCHAIH